MQAKQLLLPLLLWGTMVQAKDNSLAIKANNTFSFIENKGQVTDQYGNRRPDINYRLGGSGLSMFVGKGQLHYQWASPVARLDNDKQEIATYRMDVALVGADPHAKVVAEQKQSYYERYYTAQLGEQGVTAHAYQKITYQNVYPNIDWVLYVKGDKVEYDFVVRPGGKVSDVQLQYDGATNLAIDRSGRLIATTPSGSITEAAPISYQQADGKSISSFFSLNGNKVSFTTGDYLGTLVIDPTLSWSTYYGGIDMEVARNGCATGDKYGNAYLYGATSSTTNIATTGSFQSTFTGNTDAFLAKFNAAGVRQWATYYGGSFSENSYATTCDTFGNVYISGYTDGTSGISTTGAYQTTLAGSTDAFLVKFDTGGVRQWATYFGGSGAEQCYGITCDKSNNVYITGYTQSSTAISSTGAYQSTFGGTSDAFLAKFNTIGSLLWATYYGGSLLDYGQGITTDNNKNVYLCGYTRSTSGIATTGAFQTSWSALDDAYLVKFDSTGTRLWGTYYGGSALDRAMTLTTDPNNNVYISGVTASTTGIATTGSVQSTFGGGISSDAFLVKFNGIGARQWGTYYGTASIDDAAAICADKLGHIYLFGRTASAANIATTGAWKDTLDGTADAMLVKFDTTGNRLWATYFGGDAAEIGYGVYCNELSKVVIGGLTTSSIGLATTGSHQSTYSGGGSYDGFLAIFDDCILTDPASIIGPDTVCRGATYTYSVPPVTGAISYIWTIPTGWSGTSTTDSITVMAGSNSDTIRVTAIFACGSSSEVLKPVYVSPLPLINPSGTVSFCYGDSIVLTASAGTTYQWLNNGMAIAGATFASYTAYSTGNYSAIATSMQGCADTSLADTVTVHALPVPVITNSGTLLSTGSYATYQWQHNGTDIVGATMATYNITVLSGLYTVTVTDTNGCSGISAPFDGATTGINAHNMQINLVHVYPNPASDMVFINAPMPVNIALSSIDGRKLQYYENVKQIDLLNYSKGVYLLRITDKQNNYIGTVKITVQNNG